MKTGTLKEMARAFVEDDSNCMDSIYDPRERNIAALAFEAGALACREVAAKQCDAVEAQHAVGAPYTCHSAFRGAARDCALRIRGLFT